MWSAKVVEVVGVGFEFGFESEWSVESTVGMVGPVVLLLMLLVIGSS